MRTRSQRLLSMVLALSMLLTFLPVSAFADNTPPPHNGSQTLKNNNTCTKPGEGTYTYTLNDDDKTATLTEFTGTDADVPKTVKKDNISYTVTTIGGYAFANRDHTFNTTLQSVFLPDSIQTIEEYAFHGCSSLSNITLYEGLTEVKIYAFCFTSLETIDWPKSLTTVGAMAFHNMTDFSQGNSAKPIKTIIYHGTETEWRTLLNSEAVEGYTVADSNPQLKDVTPHCAHTVTFNMNGHGTAPEEQEVQYGEKAEKPKKDPTEEGFTFKGWYTTSAGDEAFDFDKTEITKDTELFAHWEEEQKKPDTEQPGNPGNSGQPTDKPNTEQKPDNNKTDTDKPNTQEKPNEPTPPEVPAVEEDDTAAIGYAAAAVTVAFVGWGAYRIGSEVYLKYLLPKDVLLPQNRIQLAELLWEDAGRPAPADAAPYTDVDADDTDARQAARWAVENGLLTLPDTEKPEEFAPYRSVSYAKSARAWNKAQQLKENAAAR